MAVDFFIFLLALFFLLKGAGILVDESINLAKKLKMPEVLIGMTFVAFGTSIPEIVINTSASLSGHSHIPIANILGSNIANLALIIGVGAVIREIAINREVIKFDLPLNFFALGILLVLVFVYGEILPATAGFIMLLGFLVYLFILTKQNHIKRRRKTPKKQRFHFSFFRAILSLVAVIISGALLIDKTGNIARDLGVEEGFIAFSLLAIGSSLPELVTTITAIEKKNEGLALGNVLGSNVFNILFILGISALIKPLEIDGMSTNILILCGLNIFILILATNGKKASFSKIEGMLLLLVYFASLYVNYLIT